MKVVLYKKPKNVRIIEGFPGFGLIGTIATEYLMEHLETEKIGVIETPEAAPMIAIHQNKVIEPISLHYNKKHNLVFVHAINIGKELAWLVAEAVLDVAKQLSAKEIISLEGVGSPSNEDERVFYFAGNGVAIPQSLANAASPLMEGIIIGVTGALLAKDHEIPHVALFAEAKSGIPDSKAAAHILGALGAYANLKIDPNPLLKQAQLFEKKLKTIMQQGAEAEKTQEEKQLSYVG